MLNSAEYNALSEADNPTDWADISVVPIVLSGEKSYHIEGCTADLTTLLMPTSCKSAPFGTEVIQVQSQPSRQSALDVKGIHRIVELELELLSIVHDHQGHDLPTATPIYVPIQCDGGSTHVSETCAAPPEPDSHCEGPGQFARKLTSRFRSD